MVYYEICVDVVYEFIVSSLGGELVEVFFIEIEVMVSDSVFLGMVGFFIELVDGWDVGIYYWYLIFICFVVEIECDNIGCFEDGSVIECDLLGYLNLGVGYEVSLEFLLMFFVEYYFYGLVNWGKIFEGDEFMDFYDDGWVVSLVVEWQVDESWFLSLG